MKNQRLISTFRPILAACAIIAASLLAAGCSEAPPPAGEYRAGALHITNATSRETPIPNAVGVGYLRIENTGPTDDVLLGASAKISTGIELHEMKIVDGVMQMRALGKGLPIPAGKTVELKSGGTHLMLLGVSRPLVVGETIPVILKFKNAGDAQVDLKVQALAASAG